MSNLLQELTPLQNAVHSLIKRYVQRQSIVLDAMRDLRPDMILPYESELDPQTRTELRQKYLQLQGQGFWGENQEWKYRLHGIGLHLSHTVTGEIIGWDVGSLRRFDWYWFVDYVVWLAGHDETDPNIQIINKAFNVAQADRSEQWNFFHSVLKQLETAGILRKANEHRYILL